MNTIKNTKSLGLAIVLTLFFGPLGLFYASIAGGLIMCVTPILLFALFIFGAVADSSYLLASSFILLIVFAISYWIICVIWAAIAVSNHNNKVNDAIRQAELLKNLKEAKPADTPIQNASATRQTSIQKTETNDQKEIENQIENIYFGLINGAYTAQSFEWHNT